MATRSAVFLSLKKKIGSLHQRSTNSYAVFNNQCNGMVTRSMMKAAVTTVAKTTTAAVFSQSRDNTDSNVLVGVYKIQYVDSLKGKSILELKRKNLHSSKWKTTTVAILLHRHQGRRSSYNLKLSHLVLRSCLQ